MNSKKQIESPFISVREAAEILNLNPKTVHNGGNGTGHFMRIKQGRLVRLMRSEVLEHRDRLISDAKELRRKIYGLN